MRSVTISISSSEGATLYIKKGRQDGNFVVEHWRAGDSYNRHPVSFGSNTEALAEIAALASDFVKEVG